MKPNYASALAGQSIEDVPPPTALPTGTEYSGVIKGHEYRTLQTKNGEASILTYTVKFLDWSPEIPEHERVDGKGKPIDITTKQAKMDYFISSESGLFALAQFLKSCGLKGDLEANVPLAVGQNVVADGAQKLDEKTNNVNFNLKKLKGLA